jgi:hypothetical protein
VPPPWRDLELLEELRHVLHRRNPFALTIHPEFLAKGVEVPSTKARGNDQWPVHIQLSGGLGGIDPDPRSVEMARERVLWVSDEVHSIQPSVREADVAGDHINFHSRAEATEDFERIDARDRHGVVIVEAKRPRV